MYLSIRIKFVLAIIVATAWTLLSAWIAQPWITDLAATLGKLPAYFFIGGIAIVPGFMNAFLLFSLLLDKRPARRPPGKLPTADNPDCCIQ